MVAHVKNIEMIDATRYMIEKENGRSPRTLEYYNNNILVSVKDRYNIIIDIS